MCGEHAAHGVGTGLGVTVGVGVTVHVGGGGPACALTVEVSSRLSSKNRKHPAAESRQTIRVLERLSGCELPLFSVGFMRFPFGYEQGRGKRESRRRGSSKKDAISWGVTGRDREENKSVWGSQ